MERQALTVTAICGKTIIVQNNIGDEPDIGPVADARVARKRREVIS